MGVMLVRRRADLNKWKVTSYSLLTAISFWRRNKMSSLRYHDGYPGADALPFLRPVPPSTAPFPHDVRSSRAGLTLPLL